MSARLMPIRVFSIAGYVCGSRRCRGAGDHDPSCSPGLVVTLRLAEDAEQFAPGMEISWRPRRGWRRLLWWRDERFEVIATNPDVGTVTQVPLRWSWGGWRWERAR